MSSHCVAFNDERVPWNTIDKLVHDLTVKYHLQVISQSEPSQTPLYARCIGEASSQVSAEFIRGLPASDAAKFGSAARPALFVFVDFTVDPERHTAEWRLRAPSKE